MIGACGSARWSSSPFWWLWWHSLSDWFAGRAIVAAARIERADERYARGEIDQVASVPYGRQQ